jgi:hypothetical protein
VWERRGEYRRVEEKRGKVRKQTDVPLQSSTFGRRNPRLRRQRSSTSASSSHTTRWKWIW